MKQLTAKTSFMEKIIPFIGLILLIIVVSILNLSVGSILALSSAFIALMITSGVDKFLSMAY